MNDEIKLCWAPLGSVVETIESGYKFIVGGKPQWHSSNGWYGGSSYNTGVILIDAVGNYHQPHSLSKRVRVLAKHWSDDVSFTTLRQRHATLRDEHADEVRSPEKRLSAKAKAVIKLNPFL